MATSQHHSGSTEHSKIGDIQVLRGIAIVMVLIYHLSICATALSALPVRITSPLYIGVEIFFVLSGYVITRSLMKDDYHGPRFFIKRAFRLMPALLCFIGITLVLNRHVHEADVSEFGKSLMSVPNSVFRDQARGVALGYLTLLSTPVSYVNGAMWSLSVEDQFYAGATLLCTALGTIGLPVRWRGAVLGTTAAIVYVLITAQRLFTWCGSDYAVWPAMHYITHWRFDFLALGMALAFIDRGLPECIRAQLQRSGNFCAATLLLLPVMLAAVCEIPFDSSAPVLHSVGYASMALCFAGLALLAANGVAFPASRSVAYRLIRLVGDRSYTYYLFHYPMFVVAWLIIFQTYPAAFENA